MTRLRLIGATAALLAASPPAPAPAAEAAAGRLCRYYCETINVFCQAAAAPLGSDEACSRLYSGCLDGCAAPV